MPKRIWKYRISLIVPTVEFNEVVNIEQPQTVCYSAREVREYLSFHFNLELPKHERFVGHNVWHVPFTDDEEVVVLRTLNQLPEN